MKNVMVIVVGPSGAGKSSFVDRVVAESPELVDIVTYTTRAMRAGESEGSPYHFVDKAKFEHLIGENFFVEWAHVHGNLYGSPRPQVEEAWAQGQAVIMDVDVQGAKSIVQQYPDEAFTVFILPPSIDALRQRVLKRDGGTVQDLELRMKNAVAEIDRAGEFHRQIVNDDFEASYSDFKKMIEDLLKNR